MNSNASSRPARAAWLLVGFSLLLFTVTSAFGVLRHMHVDEVGSLFSMRLTERYGLGGYATPAELYVVVLAPIAHFCASTHGLWLTLRVVYALLLLALCVGLARGQRALTGSLGRGCALLLVVTCAPLFRHGFEVRHDQFFALGLLGLYVLAERAREQRAGPKQLALAGGLLALIQACSFKAIVTLGPALLLVLWLAGRSAPYPQRFRLRLAGATALGFVAGALVAAGLLHAVGALGAYLDAQRFFRLASSSPPYRLNQLPVLELMVKQAPLQAALALLGAAATLARPRQLLVSPGFVPLCLALISWLSVLPNPTLFPYNTIWLSVPLLLLAFEGLRVVWQASLRLDAPRLRWALPGMILFLALAGWLDSSFDKFRTRTFHGQLQVVAAAEALTLPAEPVLDMSGLVASRPPPGKDWLVHSLLTRDVREGRREKIRDLIRRVGPPVLVSGHYRMGLLEPEDRRMIAQNYVAVTRELDVLGTYLPSQGSFELLRSGPYGIDAGLGELDTHRACKIDGRLVQRGQRVWLERGRHTSERVSGECRLRWLAPPGAPEPKSSPDAPLFERPSLPGQRRAQ